MKAIKETGNNLLAALDKHDSWAFLTVTFHSGRFFIQNLERF
jgi:hypothetical protein